MGFWGAFWCYRQGTGWKSSDSTGWHKPWSKKCLKTLLHAHFLSSLCFLIPFLSSHEPQCHFLAYMLDRNVPIKEREKLPNLLKKIYNTLDWTYYLPVPVFSERNIGIWINPLFPGYPQGEVAQLAVKSCPNNSQLKLSTTCLSWAGKKNIRDGSGSVWVTITTQGWGHHCDCSNQHCGTGWWPSGVGNVLDE